MDLKDIKKQLRTELKKKRQAIADGGNSAKLGKIISERISQTDEYKRADTLLIFYPVGSEINLLPLFDIARLDRKRVAFPCCKANGVMIFRYADDLSELTARSYNIPEPNEECETVTDFISSLCITPALAFDEQGFRIGYGGGYYDRFLKEYNGISIGVAYDGMIIDSLPRDEFDLSVDMIVTERRTLICQKNAQQIKRQNQ